MKLTAYNSTTGLGNQTICRIYFSGTSVRVWVVSVYIYMYICVRAIQLQGGKRSFKTKGEGDWSYLKTIGLEDRYRFQLSVALFLYIFDLVIENISKYFRFTCKSFVNRIIIVTFLPSGLHLETFFSKKKNYFYK